MYLRTEREGLTELSMQLTHDVELYDISFVTKAHMWTNDDIDYS